MTDMPGYKSLMAMTMYQFRSMFRNRMAFFFNLVLPLAFIAVFGNMFGGNGGPGKTAIGLVDRDGGPVAQQLRQALDQSGLYDVQTGDAADMEQLLRKAKVKTVVVLPDGLSRQVQAGQPVNVLLQWDKSDQSSGAAMGSLQNAIGRLNLTLSAARPLVVADARALPDTVALKVMDYLLPGQVTYALLSAGLMTVALSLANQRQSGSLRHLFSTPISVGFWTVSRLLSNVMMAVVQIGVLMGGALLMFKAHPPVNLAGTLTLLVVGAVATTGMGMAIGSLTRSPEATFPLAMSIYMGLAFLGGAMMPLDQAPQIVLVLAKFMPSHYLVHSLQLVMMQGKGLADVMTDIAVLAGVAVVLIAISIWRMRKQFLAA